MAEELISRKALLAEMRRDGEWIKDEHGALYCNICGNGAEERFGEQCETPYCNNCGAVMKNGGEPVDYKSLYPWLRLRCTMNDKDKLAKAAVWLLISLVMLAIAVAAWAQIR